MEVKLIESKELWREFVNRYAPHTFLQNWEWRLSQEVMGNQTWTIGIYQGERLMGVSFVYKIVARRGTFLFCPHGPLIINHDLEAFNSWFEYLKRLARAERADFIRVSPLELETETAIKKYKQLGFRGSPIHTHPELSWMLDLAIPETELLKNMKKRTRYSITKAQKDGVEVMVSTDPSDIDKFYEVYMETAARQIFVPFSKDYIKKEFEIFKAADQIVLFFAKYRQEVIATAMIIYCNGSGFYHHGASTRNHTAVTASEYLQWQAILEAKKRGLKYYNFWGIAPETAANHPWVGITRFKKGFGGFAEAYVHSQDYPLTSKYWLNFLIETVRRIKRRY